MQAEAAVAPDSHARCPPLLFVVQEIIVFKRQQLSYYVGNYDGYLQQVEERALHQARLAEGIERKKEHAEKR